MDTAQLVELRSVRLVVEGAGDKRIERSMTSFAGSSDEVGALDGAELGTDEDGSAFLQDRPSTE
jgi:hypothetical protein